MGWFLIVAIVMSLFIAAYVGHRLLFIFNFNKDSGFGFKNKKVFWLFIVIASLSFVATRLITGSSYWLPLIGNYVFAFILCLFFSCIVFDIYFIAYKYITRKTPTTNRKVQIAYIVLVFAVFFNGLYMANYPHIAYYNVTIDKTANVKQLRIVQITDIHINELTSPAYVQQMVKQVNALKPDYVFITGDTIDLRLKPFVDKNMSAIFTQLRPTYDTIIVFGNHEHYGAVREENNSEMQIINAFEAGNMIVLKDNVLYLPTTGIYIIGRDDYVLDQFLRSREPLSSLVAKTDLNKPILLLDHQPQDLNEPASLGVDVMFSGHTHGGQIFPMTILVRLLYENAWGELNKNIDGHQFTSIVSSGYGLWGPPIRLMSRAEIAVTDIHFTSKQ